MIHLFGYKAYNNNYDHNGRFSNDKAVVLQSQADLKLEGHVIKKPSLI